MTERVTLEAQRAGLASRLRPLYAGLQANEFERMIARIAEIELCAPGPYPVEVGAQAPRATRRTGRGNRRTAITSSAAGPGERISHHG